MAPKLRVRLVRAVGERSLRDEGEPEGHLDCREVIMLT